LALGSVHLFSAICKILVTALQSARCAIKPEAAVCLRPSRFYLMADG
jgi:hypothetical protein